MLMDHLEKNKLGGKVCIILYTTNTNQSGKLHLHNKCLIVSGLKKRVQLYTLPPRVEVQGAHTQ